MESVNYLRGLVRSWWLILLVVVAGGLGGFVIYHRATPLYRSSIRLVVATTNSSDDPASAQALSAAQASALAQFATTTPGITDATKQAFGVFSQKSGDVDSEFYLVDHTALTFLIKADGTFQGTISYEESSDTALAKIERLVQR